MGKDKLRKFAELATFKNTFELEAGRVMRGCWATQHFGNTNPLVLELACGKGEYTIGQARLFPDKNFIGVDYKGNRLWRGAKTALEEQLDNVAFLRIQIDNLTEYFAEGEVSEIWITFPDPQPQQSREKKRLTSPGFLDRYRKIVRPGAFIHLKTDNDSLYDYTQGVLTQMGFQPDAYTTDLYKSSLLSDVLSIRTYYEKKYLDTGKNINYLRWTFSNDNPVMGIRL